MASPARPTARLQFQNLATGVITRRQAVSSALVEPKWVARSMASRVAASDSRAMSASNSVITGWSTSALPKAWRCRV